MRIPASVPLYQSQIPKDLAWDLTRVLAAKGRYKITNGQLSKENLKKKKKL
jgi:hypothetical protein